MFELLSFEGRYSRGRFWLESSLAVLAFAVFFSVELVLQYKVPGHFEANVPILLLFNTVYLFCFLIVVAAAAKRCHDLDKSSLRLLVGLIPVFGIAWLIFELGLIPGLPETNRFGLPERGLRVDKGPADQNLMHEAGEADLNALIDVALDQDKQAGSALNFANSNIQGTQSGPAPAQTQFGKRHR